MASAKKTNISKKGTPVKYAEKLSNPIGKRMLLLGVIFLFLGIIFGLSLIFYTPTQEIFFQDSILKSYVISTYDAPSNICGKIGATFCAIALNVMGAAACLIPIYFIWIGILCFKRGSKPFAPASITAILSTLLIVASFFAMLKTNGYTEISGGVVGSAIYNYLLHPWLDFLGSFILLSALYAFCLIIILAQNPAMLAEEIAESLKKTPSLIGKVLTLLGAAFMFIPKLLFKSKAKAESETDAQEPVFEIKKPEKKPEPKQAEPISSFAEALDEDDQDEIEEYLQAAAIDFEEEEEEIEEFVEDSSSDESITFAPEEDDDTPEISDALKDPKSFKVSHIKEDEYKAPVPQKAKGDYVFPSMDLLKPTPKSNDDNSAAENYQDRMDHIIETLQTFNIGVTPYEAVVGPVITRYEVRPKAGVRISKISSLENDIALGLKVQKVRVSVTDRGTIGIEVPNKVRKNVSIRDILESKEWNETKAEIPVVMGKDVTGKPIVLNLAKMPHALIAGSTGSGKSVCINSIIISLLYHSTPADLRFIMVDPKMVELQIYNSLPHMLVPVVTDPRKVPAALKWLITEMMKRFAIFQKTGVRNIAGFNAKILKDKEEQERAAEMDASMTPEERAMSLHDNPEIDDVADQTEIPTTKLPYIVCIIDELADLMMVAGKEVEGSIARITQLARAAGIHMLVATQRPSTDVITGLIKSNLPTRIAFKVASQIDSRTILDGKGAETLIGWGDMLFIPPGVSEMIRAQGAFISDDEINDIVEALKINGEPEFIQEIQDQLDAAGDADDTLDGEDGREWSDALAPKAIQIIRESQRASISHLQRKLRIGYNRAASIMDELEEKGLVGPDNGPSNPREILM